MTQKERLEDFLIEAESMVRRLDYIRQTPYVSDLRPQLEAVLKVGEAFADAVFEMETAFELAKSDALEKYISRIERQWRGS